VLPPFTDLRSACRPWSTATSSRSSTAPRTSRARLRRLHRRDLRGDAGQARLHLRGGRPLRAPPVPRETDELVNAKVKAAYKHGLTPILCVGEGLEVREAGNHVAAHLSQLDGGLKGSRPSRPSHRRDRLRAGLGDRHRQGRHARGRPGGLRAIRGKLAELYGAGAGRQVRIQYGGSVKSGNAEIGPAIMVGASWTRRVRQDGFRDLSRRREPPSYAEPSPRRRLGVGAVTPTTGRALGLT
jgi:hypothetical protein